MSADQDHARVAERSREVLEESVARLDGRTLSRLTQARYAALAKRDEPRFSGRWRALAPAGAVAAALVIGIVLLVARPDGQAPGALPVTGGGEFELLVDNEALDLAESGDELEFYEWAALEAAGDGAAVGS
ncbi:MAG: hypothetical protein R3E72_08175 [Steroidobacteraceae bacterium]